MINVLIDQCGYVFLVCLFDVETANFTATFNKGNNNALLSAARLAGFSWFEVLTSASARIFNRGFAFAVLVFISLNYLAGATKRAKATRAHCLTNTVRHEPSGFKSNAKGAMQLIS